jgi:uncharacterized coiled-coil protein SlyX
VLSETCRVTVRSCENDILELEIELQSRDDAIEALNKKVTNASRDSEDMKSEFVATRALVEQLTGVSRSALEQLDLMFYFR